MQWAGQPVRRDGVLDRGFTLEVDGRFVPGVLWTPEGARGPRPLVLLGHGASRHKRVGHLVALAVRLVRGHGFAAAAIDGVGHGDRRPDRGIDPIKVFGEFPAEWSRPGSTDEMVADWTATLEALRALDEVGDGPVGYWGLSMGTIYGLPFVAGEPRVQAAVLGLMGLAGPTRERLEADARRVSCPVLVIQQWDDELFGREHVFALFDTLGTLDKRLHAHPGAHAAVPAEEMVFSARFLVRHLTNQPVTELDGTDL